MRFWRKRPVRQLAGDAPAVFARTVPGWAHLGPDERRRLADHAARLVAGKSWEPARGFTLTDAMCATIAGNAALLVLGFDDPDEMYRHVRAIVVHRSTIVSRATRPGPVAGSLTDEPVYLHGEAHDHRGPVLLAWDAVRRDTRRAANGHNVVIHEFAHKLDMLDGLIDGTPAIEGPLRARWVAVCTAAYGALRAADGPDPVLRDYATVDPGEFYAVACETFFDRPVELRDRWGDLYGVLRDHLRQDPASRVPELPPAVEGSVP